LPQVAVPDITLERPQNPAHGDYATSLPLKLARACAMNPMLIARSLAGYLESTPELSFVAPAPPGFLNFTAAPPGSRPRWMPSSPLAKGTANCPWRRHSLQVEFVSANPTGPLHVGHGRGAVLGSTLAAVLAAAGYAVQKEYYVNDAGSQMQAFYHSLWARYQQELGREAAMPESGYFGHYMIDLAQEIASEYGGRFLDAPGGREELGRLGLRKMLAVIEDDLKALRVSYDCWFSEQSLYDSASSTACWRSSAARLPGGQGGGDLVRLHRPGRRQGQRGYPLGWLGHLLRHRHSLSLRQVHRRGFEQVIDIWGADHQGHVPRMKAVATALGIDPNRLIVIISQLVTLRRGGECVKVSKRSGR